MLPKPYQKRGPSVPGRDLGFLAGALPYLQQELEDMKANVAALALRQIREGSLDPDTALLLWHQYAALSSLQTRMDSKIRLGAVDNDALLTGRAPPT